MPTFSLVMLTLALLLLGGMFGYDPKGTAYRLGRILTFYGRLHMPARKPKERLLSPPELAALEIECGIEPSWTPPPRKGFKTFTPSVVLPSELPPFASLVTPMSAWTPPSAALIPVWSDCDDCETVETRRRGDPTPARWLSKPCPRHQAMLRDAQEAR